jgi:enterochelin esterase-like enzyme
VETVEIESAWLGKAMRLSVLLPDGYSEEQRHPVLYFVPYAGGGPGAITRMFQTDGEYSRLLGSAPPPLVIVGVPHDGSFLFDTEPPHQELELADGITLRQGYYETFFIDEVIPYVEKAYSVADEPSGRFIGGYSMGGHAALRIALTHPGLFSRVGAHSPTLFEESLPDESVTRFMYPDEKTRAERDPLALVHTVESPAGTAFYVDTGELDVNRSACERITQDLHARGAEAEFHVLSGGHGTSYLAEHLTDYLRFYIAP